MGWVKFTGEYGKLKTMGYTFQKLYAANYMSWHRGDLFIFKKGHDITHSEMNLYDFISFMRTHPVVKEHSYGHGDDAGVIVSFIIEYDDKNNVKFFPYDDENRKRMVDTMMEWGEWDKDSGKPAPPMMSTRAVNKELIEQLKELNDLGWYELVHEDITA